MSDPVGGLLEGLLEGGERGFTFRENIKANKRRQRLDEELMTLRELESRRAEAASQREEAAAGREQTKFTEEQDAYNRAQRLRTEVGNYLKAPVGYRTPGQYLGGKKPERLAAPLSTDATTAMEVGRTLGGFSGAELSDEEALLVGSGMVPASAVQPKAYRPRSRQEYLDNLRYAASLRVGRGGGAGGTKLPITLDHALAAVDNIYGIWEGGQRTGHYLTPAKRLELARKMVAGTVQPTDFPDIPGEARAPAAAPAPEDQGGEGILSRGWHWLFGGSGGGSPTGQVHAPDIRKPAGAPGPGAPVAPQPGAPTSGVDPQAVEELRALVEQYRDVPDDDLRAALSDEGYDDVTIEAVLGPKGP